MQKNRAIGCLHSVQKRDDFCVNEKSKYKNLRMQRKLKYLLKSSGRKERVRERYKNRIVDINAMTKKEMATKKLLGEKKTTNKCNTGKYV